LDVGLWENAVTMANYCPNLMTTVTKECRVRSKHRRVTREVSMAIARLGATWVAEEAPNRDRMLGMKR
jgi:hypothetical protein